MPLLSLLEKDAGLPCNLAAAARESFNLCSLVNGGCGTPILDALIRSQVSTECVFPSMPLGCGIRFHKVFILSLIALFFSSRVCRAERIFFCINGDFRSNGLTLTRLVMQPNDNAFLTTFAGCRPKSFAIDFNHGALLPSLILYASRSASHSSCVHGLTSNGATSPFWRSRYRRFASTFLLAPWQRPWHDKRLNHTPSYVAQRDRTPPTRPLRGAAMRPTQGPAVSARERDLPYRSIMVTSYVLAQDPSRSPHRRGLSHIPIALPSG